VEQPHQPAQEHGSGASRWEDTLKLGATAASILGLVAYGLVGFAYFYFYGQLGVRPSEIGLGFAEIVGQAVFGLLLVLVIFGAYLAMLAFFNFIIYALFISTPPKTSASSDRGSSGPGVWGWVGFGLILTMTVGFIIGSSGLVNTAAYSVTVLALLGILIRTVRDPNRVNLKPKLHDLVLISALFQLVAILFFALTAIWLGPSPVVWILLALVLLVIFGTSLGMPIFFYRIRSTEDVPSWLPTGWKLWVATATTAAVLTAVIVGATAYDDAQATARGASRSGFLTGVASAGVTCVDVTWLGDPLEVGLASPLLYLGQGNGRVVLYEPGVGAVRLPASQTVIRGVPSEACEIEDVEEANEN